MADPLYRKRLKPFDLKARAAIHVGECEVRGDDFSGVAVDVSSPASRYSLANDPGNVAYSYHFGYPRAVLDVMSDQTAKAAR